MSHHVNRKAKMRDVRRQIEHAHSYVNFAAAIALPLGSPATDLADRAKKAIDDVMLEFQDLEVRERELAPEGR